MYASESQYTDVDGVSKYFVPADKVLVAASGLQGTLAYAGIVQVDEDGNGMQPYEATRLPLVYYEKGYDFRKVRLSSRPIPNSGGHTKLDNSRCNLKFEYYANIYIFLQTLVTS